LGKRGGKWRSEPGQQSEEEAVDFHNGKVSGAQRKRRSGYSLFSNIGRAL
jgi:hypothetical protein